jgi:hypothetical protein
MTTTHVDVEEIETTKSEKLLAVVLALFLLIGGIWAYTQTDDYVRDALPIKAAFTPAERAAVERATAARSRLFTAQAERRRAREELELRREAYRTALDEGRRAPALQRDYNQAQERFVQAERALASAEARLSATEAAASDAHRRRAKQATDQRDRQELVSFLVRLLFVLALVALGYWILDRARKRNSRYLPAALAFVAFAAILAFAMAADYVTDYVDPLDLGPLLLSLTGVGATLAAFAAVTRFVARRTPYRRARKRECPFCGYPVRENQHCEGCGRDVLADCTTCGGPRRVGTPHCAACGAS